MSEGGSIIMGMENKQMTNKYNNYLNDSGAWEDWIELLCTYGDYNDYLEIEFNSISKPIAIMEYRNKLYQEGLGNVGKEELKKTYSQKTLEELHILCEYMFLEPIPYDKFKFILNKLNMRKPKVLTAIL